MKLTVKDLNKVGDLYREVAIRQLRKPLLEAFDIYKSNINYGVEIETVNEHNDIMIWYQGLLDKEIWALENIPVKIQRYI